MTLDQSYPILHRLMIEPEVQRCYGGCKRLRSIEDFDVKKGGRERYHICFECREKRLCGHRREKYTCVPCGGSKICSHQRIKYQCIDCGGSTICNHLLRRLICRKCHPEIRLYNKLYWRRKLRDPHTRKVRNLQHGLARVRKGGRFGQKSKLRDYVNCTPDFLRQWLTYTERQYCNNKDEKISIDHLKPLSQIRPDCEEDFYTYFSWHNTRLIPAKENRIKHSKEPTDMEIEQQECYVADFLDLIVFTT